MGTPSGTAPAVGARPILRSRAWVAPLCWTAVLLDGFDAVVLGAVLPSMLENGELGMTTAQGTAVATAGLLLVILRAPQARVAAMVAAYIGAAYWFTASTSFANPAAVFGRMFSDSFAGIAPSSVPGFMAAQLLGAAAGLLLHRCLGDAEARA